MYLILNIEEIHSFNSFQHIKYDIKSRIQKTIKNNISNIREFVTSKHLQKYTLDLTKNQWFVLAEEVTLKDHLDMDL